MKERPCLMNGDMVRATLAGVKTQTRRPIKHQPPIVRGLDKSDWNFRKEKISECPFGVPGDRLWVRETFMALGEGTTKIMCYKADGWTIDKNGDWPAKWTPSIHMPRWACRLVLEITEVRVERVREITDEGALDEGVNRTKTSIPGCATKRFKWLWNYCYGPCAWERNDWVWVIGFKRLEEQSK